MAEEKPGFLRRLFGGQPAEAPKPAVPVPVPVPASPAADLQDEAAIPPGPPETSPAFVEAARKAYPA